jgi:hypothetical protein
MSIGQADYPGRPGRSGHVGSRQINLHRLAVRKSTVKGWIRATPAGALID